jgi:hypothetical protein
MSLLTCPHCLIPYLSADISCPHCTSKPQLTNRLPLALLMGLGLAACEPINDTKPLYGAEIIDGDNDGYLPNGDDCDDADPLTYPGAATQDSETDCMTDADQDGFGDDSPENEAITPGSDCDDSDPDINPAAGNCPE